MVFYPFERWSSWQVGHDFSNMSDEEIMMRAFEIAAQHVGHTNPNPSVGAIIVSGGLLLAWGQTQQAGGNHAEIEAINMALEIAPDKLENSTIYVTLEPCAHYGRTPPCAKALVDVKVSRVVISVLDQNPLVAGQGVQILINNGIEVTQGVSEKFGSEFYEPFFHWVSHQLPWVTVKTACAHDGGMNQLIDGRPAPLSITGELTNSKMTLLRRRSQGIFIGGATMRADHPQLNLRNYRPGPLESPSDPNVYIMTKDSQSMQQEVFNHDSLAHRSTIINFNSSLTKSIHSQLSRIGAEGAHQILIEAGPNLSRMLWENKFFNEWVFLKGNHVDTNQNGPWGLSKWYPSPLSCGEISKFGTIEEDQFLVLKNPKALSP